ncbi:MAG: cytochrome C [Gammaproteobacteria bacterium 28-57-27]|nr:MAG: cytochrome C [Gammaproteobacteria bacterium 28-57-27]
MIGVALAGVMSMPLAMTSAVAAPQATTPQATGEMMGNTCAGCHGTHGRLKGEAFMPLAGMQESTFIKAMQDFRSGARPATLMGHVARGYNDEQIKAMAEFFAKVKP